MIDLHCHILAGLDDGPGDWAESLDMARLLAADGVATVVATPHQLGGFADNRATAIRVAVAEFRSQLDEHEIPLRVFAGGEVRIEPDLAARVRDGEALTLADSGRYVLLELPHEVYLPLDRVLEELAEAGLVGILSHPERNRGIQARPRVLDRLVDAGCLMQVTAGSLLGEFGARAAGLAEQLVKQGRAHFLATDAHGSRRRRPVLRPAMERMAHLAGRDAAAACCQTNPACVLEGRPLPEAAVCRPAPGRPWWLSWLKAG